MDNCLNLNLTDLFSDDLLVVLPDDSELLLDNLNGLGMADNFFFLDQSLGNSTEVVGAIKVVKVAHGVVAVVAVEGGVAVTFRHEVHEGRNGLRGGHGSKRQSTD